MDTATLNKKTLFESILQKSDDILNSESSLDEKLQQICNLLNREVPYYNWVGFYLVDPQRPRELILGPYIGEATDHTRIPFGKGICGQAAETEKTFVIQDVSQEDNYLACSLTVKSEIVVPIFKNSNIYGELDIDSHILSPFTDEDLTFLETLCEKIGKQL
jgi:GAF domain-containing protein